MTTLDERIKELQQDPEFNSEYTIIGFINDVLEEMEKQGITRIDMAHKMDIELRSFMDYLNCSPRMTSLTMHKIALALGKKIRITLE